MKAVSSVDRALDVLRHFITKPASSASEIQRSLQLSRPTVYRLLKILERNGFVRSSGEPRRYQLTEVALQLANAWLSVNEASRVSTPYLRKLWEDSQETVGLIVPHSESERILIQELRSTQPLSLSLGVGYVAPLHRGTSGKIILAFLPEPTIHKVLLTIPSKKDRETVAATLPRIRKERTCSSSGEVLAGGASIASPVFDRSGSVVAAVTVFGPEARLRGSHQLRCKKLVRQTADAISKALGFDNSLRPD